MFGRYVLLGERATAQLSVRSMSGLDMNPSRIDRPMEACLFA